MDIVTDILVGLAVKLIPFFWQLLLGAVLGFAAGCWWYRRTLKKNPEKLQKLVVVVNAATNKARAVVSNVIQPRDES